MLEKLGIFGMEKVESAILAGLVTGDPVLLVGSHGAGKTLLSERLAEAMNVNFWAYDASKALFEDVLGFPNPGSLTSGQIEYVPTSISIWGKEFVLVDELSRANPSMQNKWLEVIRSRRIMGKDLPDLKYIIAAMNPPSYIGANPLDAALAGRFSFVVSVPEVSDMPEEAVSKILCQVSEDDAPMLADKRRTLKCFELTSFIEQCRERMTTLPEKYDNKFSEYVMAINQFMISREIALDGRRLGMIWRNLKSYLSVVMEKEGSERPALEDYDDEICEAVSFSVPFAAIGEEMALSAIKGAHHYAKAALNGGIASPVLVLPKDPLRAKDELIKRASEIMPDERKSGLTKLISRAKSSQKTEDQAPSMMAIIDLCFSLCNGEFELVPEDEHRLLSYYMKMTTADEEDLDDTFRSLIDVLELDDTFFDNPEVFLNFRLAYSANENSGHRRGGRDENAILKLAKELDLVSANNGDI